MLLCPEGVTHLGANVFNTCKLTSVTLPQSLQAIGTHTFGCGFNLKELVIPESVTVIKSKAFCLSSIHKIT